jgi:hypothetical protein
MKRALQKVAVFLLVFVVYLLVFAMAIGLLMSTIAGLGWLAYKWVDMFKGWFGDIGFVFAGLAFMGIVGALIAAIAATCDD